MEFNPAILANLPPPSATARDGSKNIMKRVTKGGRVLWYEMSLIQEPERARACGSGPKSSADRRPVDPPPVIQFRVYEGEDIKNARDITFDYNADFFAYTSLEQARPMASGRLQTQPPVLSGLPVAGCSYLDRPHPAGYFIFPDLSVRHEGLYKLVFTLYELTKEDADADAVDPNADRDEDDQMINDIGQNWYCRMEVTSSDFTVYSAKKFPGLAESTNLSRTVAEQGCRVRIRRDVRMRRRDRDRKPTAVSGRDKAPEDNFGPPPPRNATPDIRPRSESHSSMDRNSYGQDPQRRPSILDHRAGPGGPLDFAGRGGNAAGFAPPPPTGYAPPPPTSYTAHRASPAPSAYSSTGPPIPYPALPSPTGSVTGYPSQSFGYGDRPMSRHESDFRRTSTTSYYAPIAPASKVSIPPSRSSISLAAFDVIARSAGLGSRELPAPEPKQYYHTAAPAQIKRRRHDAFFTSDDARLANHQRPSEQQLDEHDPDRLEYKRADGSWWHALPDGGTAPMANEAR